ncbi:hypothetical protein SAMN05421754_102030 [Nitrosomonas sp. Nm58]|nr:hypothetical protein SAMN05421754_102030 [Nitrosomonas sp. Nm58]
MTDSNLFKLGKPNVHDLLQRNSAGRSLQDTGCGH